MEKPNRKIGDEEFLSLAERIVRKTLEIRVPTILKGGKLSLGYFDRGDFFELEEGEEPPSEGPGRSMVVLWENPSGKPGFGHAVWHGLSKEGLKAGFLLAAMRTLGAHSLEELELVLEAGGF